MHTISALTVACVGAVSTPVAPGADWSTDLGAARTAAERTGKDILIEFTGSDWCTWCMRLEKDVLSSDAFAAYAEDRFVLVQLDYPRDTSGMTEEHVARNEALKNVYRPNGLPTVVLADHAGRPYARLTGYEPRDAWMKALADAATRKKRRDAALARAERLEGRTRAAALRSVLDGMDVADARAYEQIAAEIHRLETGGRKADADTAWQHYVRSRPPVRQVRPPGSMNRAPDPPAVPAAPAAPPGASTGSAAGRPTVTHNHDEFRSILELLAGERGGAPDVTTDAFRLGVTRALAYRYRVGSWPTGAPGNRAVIAVMAWAEAQGDLDLYAALLAELPAVRRPLANNEAFIGRLRSRLVALRGGTAEGTFYTWLFDRAGGG